MWTIAVSVEKCFLCSCKFRTTSGVAVAIAVANTSMGSVEAEHTRMHTANQIYSSHANNPLWCGTKRTSHRLSLYPPLCCFVSPRLSSIDLGPNRVEAAKLTLNKQGEVLRWFYFPFEEEEEGKDLSRPRTKAPPRIISPKLYCCGQPEFEDMVGTERTERVSADM